MMQRGDDGDEEMSPSLLCRGAIDLQKAIDDVFLCWKVSQGIGCPLKKCVDAIFYRRYTLAESDSRTR